ncbi:MAG TPA: 2,3-bisphosphoglycerate-independent phosphoglycerate mutase [Candidatus Andersenbacteria bacterium]|nr:MAG: phosphoglycerate mutase (2,3-diphosphoglycerate-independent) [Candidatus Andersenbacteria bacterium RIFCSPHIGHO2_02_FULL_46_16]HBE90053.1 2,3-bisphosphoglycerate-independent phosphoglycerate mutase [Candidatus Andersenbacteria bacterium]
MNTLPRPRPLVVIILDGWGLSLKGEGNAVEAAATPTMDMFASYYPGASLVASGLEVGLPLGVAGNSETGHRNIGAGSVEYQIMADINQAIDDGSFFRKEELLNAVNHARENGSDLHLMGLVSPGGVHAHSNHLVALLQMLAKEKFRDRVFIHMFTDGRDAPPKSSPIYLRQLQEAIGHWGVGIIASVTGRFYAMDRNENWERTQETFDMLTGGIRPDGAPTPEIAISQAHNAGLTDEKIPTTVITSGGSPIALIKDDDAVIFFNFRPDRARQLTAAFVAPDKVGWPAKRLKNLYFVMLNMYDKELPAPAAFYERKADYPLARVISEAGLMQLHVAETEKYAHITYYLNVGEDEPFSGEVHDLVHSSGVKDWAKKPRMEAEVIAKRVIDEIERGAYDVYFVNFANADMVGHTGDFDATVKACACVDECLDKICSRVHQQGGAMIITADHGKAEEVGEKETHQQFTEHTKNPVPFYYVREELRRTTRKSDSEVITNLSSPIGVLADVAPTILDVLKLDKPDTMTGVSLLGSLQ